MEDERGFFARSWDKQKFEELGLNSRSLQCNVSFSKSKGTLRGMHFQISPYEETKLVRCTKGKIFDVIIDIREKSPTFKKWIGVELTADNHKMLYVPEGFAHGFETLEDNSEVFYQVSQVYMKSFEGGYRWDDPAFSIKWPEKPKSISEKDNSWKFLEK